MFITYQPFPENAQGNEAHIGNTVSILKKEKFPNKFMVGAYKADGNWEEWVAHVDELDGFEGV